MPGFNDLSLNAQMIVDYTNASRTGHDLEGQIMNDNAGRRWRTPRQHARVLRRTCRRFAGYAVDALNAHNPEPFAAADIDAAADVLYGQYRHRRWHDPPV